MVQSCDSCNRVRLEDSEKEKPNVVVRSLACATLAADDSNCDKKSHKDAKIMEPQVLHHPLVKSIDDEDERNYTNSDEDHYGTDRVHFFDETQSVLIVRNFDLRFEKGVFPLEVGLFA